MADERSQPAMVTQYRQQKPGIYKCGASTIEARTDLSIKRSDTDHTGPHAGTISHVCGLEQGHIQQGEEWCRCKWCGHQFKKIG